MKRISILLLTLFACLALFATMNMQMFRAVGGGTVTAATYEDPFPIMPFGGAGDPENYITFLYESFVEGDPRLILNKDADIVDSKIRVAPAGIKKGGSVFNKERVSLQDDRSFSTYFTFELSDGGGYGAGWADGLVFTVQTQSNSASSIGGTLGYNGITPSVAVKFDTWANGEHGDPSDNHIAILKDGKINAPVTVKAVNKADLDFRNGTIHAWIDYDGPNGIFEVRLNKNSPERPADAELSWTLPEGNRLTTILDSDMVYVGFTASTGDAFQNHDITTWYFTNKLDPIDIVNIDYKQAPTGYDISPQTQEDGTVQLTITPTGGDDANNVAISISGTNGVVLDPVAANTGMLGYAIVNAASPDGDTLVTTVTVQGPAGISSSKEITIPGRTAAPVADNILANATDGTVTVTGVPAGADVKIYDHDDQQIGFQTGVAGGTAQFAGLDDLSTAHPIRVTFEVSPKVESEKTSVIPKVRSVLDAADVQVNATTDEAVVLGVVPNGIIRIYDAPAPGGNLIGHAENEEAISAAVTALIGAPGVAHQQKVYATLQNPGELESLRVEVTAKEESNQLDDDKIETDGTSGKVTIEDVPEGATVIIYDEDGNEIGQGTNTGPGTTVVIDDLDLEIGDSIQITITEEDKLESDPIVVPVTFTPSDPPDHIDANATLSVVTVEDVPQGATVTIFDGDGNELKTATNLEAGKAAVAIPFNAPRLMKGQALEAAITEPRKTMSAKVSVTAYYEQSAPLDAARIVANATDNLVIVQDVPPGATITVYSADGNVVIGSGDHPVAVNAAVAVTPHPPLAAGSSVQVSITEMYHDESDQTERSALEKTARLAEERIRANATDSTVTFADIPAGAEIFVYDEHDQLIAYVKNDGDEATDLTADIDLPKLTAGQQIGVTIREVNKLVSDPTNATAYEKSKAPTLPDVLDIEVEAGTVTMGNVPVGTTVILYDPDNVEIGRDTFAGPAVGEITITVALLKDQFKVTYTEPSKYESDPLIVDVQTKTQEAVDDAARELEIGFQATDTWESVTLPVIVVTVGKHNTSVSWTSNKPSVVKITDPVNDTITAQVIRQPQDESVILTAKVTKNDAVRIRTFLIIVKADGLEKDVDKKYRRAKINVGEDGEEIDQVDIERISLTNGSKIDKAIFDAATATDFIQDPSTADDIARIYVDSPPGDEPDEIAVEVQEAAIQLLAGNGNSLEIGTDYGSIRIAGAELEEMAYNALDLFFRLVPVTEAERQRDINRSVIRADIVKSEAGNKVVEVLGSSLEIETNYTGYKTTLLLPFAKNGIQLPAARVDDFLASLRVYIEHSDGNEDLQPGTVIYDNGIPIGLSIEIDKFSTFSIIRLKPAPAIGPYPDMDAEQEPIDDLETSDPGFHKAYISGYEDGTFRPERAVTRAEFAAMLARNMNFPLRDTHQGLFPDVAESHWAYSYIEALKEASLLVGDPSGRFRPDDAITRAEMAIIAAKWLLADLQNAPANLFPDVHDSHWAAGAITIANEAGIMVGFPNGTFGPEEPVTRAQAVAIMNRLLDRVRFIADGSPTWPDVDVKHWAFADIEEASRDHAYHYLPDGTEVWLED